MVPVCIIVAISTLLCISYVIFLSIPQSQQENVIVLSHQKQISTLSPDNQDRLILLKGQPKSGTTWAEILTFEMVNKLCSDSSKIKQCRKVGAFDQTKSRNFKIEFNSNRSVLFLQKDKHYLGLHRICKEQKSLLHRAPCHLNLTYPQDATDDFLSTFRNCSQKCLDNDLRKTIMLRRSPYWLYVMRDPREVAVSHCYFIQHKEPMALDACLKKVYPYTVMWTKLRHIENAIFDKEHKRHIFCYEEMVSPDRRVKIAGMKKLMNHFGFQIPSDKVIMNIFRAISPDKLVSNSSSYNPHDQDGPKVRVDSAGQKTLSDYDLDPHLYQWMNRMYDVFEKIEPSPCAEYRLALERALHS